MFTIFDVRRSLTQRASIEYLSLAILAIGIAHSLLLMVAQVLKQLAAIGFIRIFLAGHGNNGQQQLADLMTRLILLVQSPRKRVPVRNKAGDIEHVIDTIEPGATLQ